MATDKLPIIIILGPTASGKTGLSLKIAKKLGNIEIICADSRTIYRGMDIGTAKPSAQEQAVAPHHLIDILNPDQRYSAAEFQRQAKLLINDIKKRNNIPVIVGGTGLYVFSIIYDYSFPAGPASASRSELESKDIEELKSMLQYLDAEAFSMIDTSNPRRVIRAIETAGMDKPDNSQLIDNVCVLGIQIPLPQLEQRISARTKQMIDTGLVEEVKSLVDQYGQDIEPLQTVGYKEMVDYIMGKQSLNETIELINLHTRQLSKRQMTWFKRSK